MNRIGRDSRLGQIVPIAWCVRPNGGNKFGTFGRSLRLRLRGSNMPAWSKTRIVPRRTAKRVSLASLSNMWKRHLMPASATRCAGTVHTRDENAAGARTPAVPTFRSGGFVGS